ncbi:hypothetical protein ACPR111641_09775 [Acinetobacter pragensis]
MNLPNVDMNLLDQPTLEKVQAKEVNHPPRILLLYGSNRERSYSRIGGDGSRTYFGAVWC